MYLTPYVDSCTFPHLALITLDILLVFVQFLAGRLTTSYPFCVITDTLVSGCNIAVYADWSQLPVEIAFLFPFVCYERRALATVRRENVAKPKRFENYILYLAQQLQGFPVEGLLDIISGRSVVEHADVVLRTIVAGWYQSLFLHFCEWLYFVQLFSSHGYLLDFLFFVHPLLLFVHIYTGCTAPFVGLLIGWH
mgnify:CR=1 FL=1